MSLSRMLAVEVVSGTYLFRVEKGWFECGYLEPEEQRDGVAMNQHGKHCEEGRFLKN